LADENGKFFQEKVKFLKFSRKSKKNFENRGESETGRGNASWPQGGWTPLSIIPGTLSPKLKCHLFKLSNPDPSRHPPSPSERHSTLTATLISSGAIELLRLGLRLLILWIFIFSQNLVSSHWYKNMLKRYNSNRYWNLGINPSLLWFVAASPLSRTARGKCEAIGKQM